MEYPALVLHAKGRAGSVSFASLHVLFIITDTKESSCGSDAGHRGLCLPPHKQSTKFSQTYLAALRTAVSVYHMRSHKSSDAHKPGCPGIAKCFSICWTRMLNINPQDILVRGSSVAFVLQKTLKLSENNQIFLNRFYAVNI